MKRLPLLLAALLIVLASARAADSFPGLKAVLTPEEWQRAGLDRLTPDQIGVIDAALIRRTKAAAVQHEAAVAQARTEAQRAALPQPPVEPAQKKRFIDRFGLPFLDDDWRSLPPLQGKVVAWEAPNRFRLESGQIWEGTEAIPYELPGKEIEIHARPNNQFVLVVDGKSTSIRIFRLR